MFIELPINATTTGNDDVSDPVLREFLNAPESFETTVLVNVHEIEHMINGKSNTTTIYMKTGQVLVTDIDTDGILAKIEAAKNSH